MTLTVDELKELLNLMVGTKGVVEIDEKAPISRKVLNEFLDKKGELDKDNPYEVTVTPLDYTNQTGTVVSPTNTNIQ